MIYDDYHNFTNYRSNAEVRKWDNDKKDDGSDNLKTIQESHSITPNFIQDARFDQPEARLPWDHQVGIMIIINNNTMMMIIIKIINIIVIITTITTRDVASEMKLLLDAAGRLAPMLPEQVVKIFFFLNMIIFTDHYYCHYIMLLFTSGLIPYCHHDIIVIVSLLKKLYPITIIFNDITYILLNLILKVYSIF